MNKIILGSLLSCVVLFSGTLNFNDLTKNAKKQVDNKKLNGILQKYQSKIKKDTKKDNPFEIKKEPTIKKTKKTPKKEKAHSIKTFYEEPVLFTMALDKNGDAIFENGQENYPNKSLKNDVILKKKVIKESVDVNSKNVKNIESSNLLDIAKKNGISKKYIDAYSQLKKISSVLYSDNFNFNKFIDNKFSSFIGKNKKTLTIFFFVDSHMSIESFKRFSDEMSRIRLVNRRAEGRILTNGLVIMDEEKKSYLKDLKKLKRIKNKTDENLKQIKKLEYLSEGNFDTNYRWMKYLYQSGLRGLKIHFHPYAFKRMELNRVPAYLVSKCSSDDFSFKKCNHIALVRGNISLRKAFEIFSEDDDSFLKYYQSLLQ